MIRAFVGMGSNLGDRREALSRALGAMDRLPGTTVVGVSSIYDTDALGDSEAPPFLNAVALLETALDAGDLLEHLQRLEQRLGRLPPRHGPRPVDLDLLFFGEECIGRPGLAVPHPACAERLFVLVPMVELEPGWVDPRSGQRMDQLLSRRGGREAVRYAGRFPR